MAKPPFSSDHDALTPTFPYLFILLLVPVVLELSLSNVKVRKSGWDFLPQEGLFCVPGLK